jgi:formylglycine-generating enzyme required for sulfatase activity
VSAILDHPDVPDRRGQNLLLGGRAFLEAEFAAAEPERRLVIRDRLFASLADLTIPARMRAPLGSLLAEYGDPRREVTTVREIRWVDVPEGACWIGSEAEGAHDDERPQKYVEFPAFRIMQYPVTQAQYAEFVRATRHPAPTSEHWPGYSWRDNRPPRGKENHPMVLVSFADAVAFCKWLSGELGFEVRLPTEGEWEYAAKGPQPREERERTCPWGNAFDAEKCNTMESGIGGTSPVGMFPHGQRPDGPHEMAGNVWEWTASVYKKYPYRPEGDDGWERRHTNREAARTVRGGSWNFPQVNARCAYRLGLRPVVRDDGLGFRCCSGSPGAAES